MAGANSLGIVIELDANGAIIGARNLAGALGGAADAARGAANAAGQAGRRVNEMNQGIMNLQMGLQQVGGWFKQASDGIGAFTEANQAAFESFDTGMRRVAIVMGKTGERANDAKLVQEYGRIQKKIMEIGRDTEFMMSQASDAFVNLKQAGLSANDALGIIDKTMAFSSASAGTVDLASAADTATLAVAGFGVSVDEVGKTGGILDQMVRTQNISKISLREFGILMRSMGPSASTFKKTSAPEFLAIAAAMRQMGQSAAQAGNGFQGMSRKLVHILTNLQKRKGKRYKALEELGLGKEDFVDGEGNYLNMIDMVQGIHGKIAALRAKWKAEGDTRGDAGVLGLLSTGFGSQQAVNMILQTDAYAKQYGKSIRDLTGMIKAAGNDAVDAQQTFLAGMEGKRMIMEGSIDRMRTILFGLDFSTKFVTEKITEIVNILAEFVNANEGFFRVFMPLVGFLGIALGAFAALTFVVGGLVTAMMALQALLPGLGAAMTFAGLRAAFMSSVMTPLLTLFAPVLSVMAAVTVGIGLFALAYQTNFGGLRDFLQGWVLVIKQVFNVIGPMLSGEGITLDKWEELHPMAQKVTRLIVIMRAHVVALGEGFTSGLTPPLKVTVWILDKLAIALMTVGRFLGFVTIETANYTLGTELAQGGTKNIGRILGFVAGIWISYKLIVYATKIAVWGYTAATKLATLATWLWSSGATNAMWAGRVLAPVIKGLTWAMKGLGKAVLFVAKGALSLMANPVVLLVVVIVALVAALVMLIFYFDETVAFLDKHADGWFEWTESIKSFQAVTDALADWLADAVQFFTNFSDNIRILWDGLWIWVMAQLETFGRWFLGNDLYEAGANWVQSLWDGMKVKFAEMVTWLGTQVDKVAGMWPFSPAKWGPLRDKPPEKAGAKYIGLIQSGMQAQAPKLTGAVENTLTNVANTVENTLANPVSGGIGSMLPDEDGVRVASFFDPQAPATPAAASIQSPSSTAPAKKDAAAAPASVINVTVSFGDVKLSPRSLDGASAREFVAWITEQLGDTLEKELRSRALA